MNLMPPVNGPRTAETPGSRSFEFRLLEENRHPRDIQLGSFSFRKTWVPVSNSPAWDQVESPLTRLRQQPEVKIVLTKPSKDSQVLEFDPLLRSTGKAGVSAIYNHLETALSRL
jgi:hypothetical protein